MGIGRIANRLDPPHRNDWLWHRVGVVRLDEREGNFLAEDWLNRNRSCSNADALGEADTGRVGEEELERFDQHPVYIGRALLVGDATGDAVAEVDREVQQGVVRRFARSRFQCVLCGLQPLLRAGQLSFGFLEELKDQISLRIVLGDRGAVATLVLLDHPLLILNLGLGPRHQLSHSIALV